MPLLCGDWSLMMAEFYVTQEKAMAPGIAGDWPKVIAKPDSPHGRLVKVEGVQEMIDGIQKMLDYKDAGGDGWWAGFDMAVSGHSKASA
jgi:hypothetical protein